MHTSNNKLIHITTHQPLKSSQDNPIQLPKSEHYRKHYQHNHHFKQLSMRKQVPNTYSIKPAENRNTKITSKSRVFETYRIKADAVKETGTGSGRKCLRQNPESGKQEQENKKTYQSVTRRTSPRF